jgi:anti-anti-sigma factor
MKKRTKGKILIDRIEGLLWGKRGKRGRLNAGLKAGLRKRLRVRPRDEGLVKGNIKKVEFRSGVAVVRLSGNITFDTLRAKAGEEEFRIKSKGRPVKNILLDLKDVPHADTAAIAVLVNRLAYLNRRYGGGIGLINLSPRMRNLLEISKTKELFKEYPSEEQAIEDLK